MLVMYMETLHPISWWRIRIPRIGHGSLEGETATQQEGDQVIPPVGDQGLHFSHKLAVLVNAVTGRIGADVAARSGNPRLHVTRLHYFQQGAGLRVALAK